MEDRPRLFSVMPTNRTRVNGHKLNYREFCLKTNKNIIFYCKQNHNFFIVRMVEQVLWEGCGVSVSGDIQNKSGHGPEQSALDNL